MRVPFTLRVLDMITLTWVINSSYENSFLYYPYTSFLFSLYSYLRSICALQKKLDLFFLLQNTKLNIFDWKKDSIYKCSLYYI